MMILGIDVGGSTTANAIGAGHGSGLDRMVVVIKASDLDYVISMAMRGTVSSVDLQIGDICREELPGLPLDATASNFGKADTAAQAEDVAAGVINMILQTVGSAANFISLGTGIKDFVLIGNLSLLPQCRSVFDRIGRLYGLDFHIPEHTLYRTALGAALYALKDNG